VSFHGLVDQEPGLKHMKPRPWLHTYTTDDAAHKSSMESKTNPFGLLTAKYSFGGSFLEMRFPLT